MSTVYLETTIIGHLVGRIRSDPIVSARQHSTRDWWQSASANYHLVASELVEDECRRGDSEAAQERLAVLQDLDYVKMSSDATMLAEALINSKAVPASEPRDALHISLAATGGIQFLLTWNFKHIANASLRVRIEQTCRDSGFEPPIICTPDELIGE